jgi:hypothetical protein
MASLTLQGGWQVLRQARAELKGETPSADANGHSHANDHGY